MKRISLMCHAFFDWFMVLAMRLGRISSLFFSVMLLAMSIANAELYKSYQHTISPVPGTHTFTVENIESYRDTKWFINNTLQKTQSSGWFAVEPTLDVTFSSGDSKIIVAEVYLSNSPYTKQQVYTWTATAVPSTPTTLTASNLTKYSATNSWSTVAGAPNYTHYIRKSGTAAWTSTPNIAGSPVSLSGLLPATSYDVRVKACNAAGCSAEIERPGLFTTLANTGPGQVGTIAKTSGSTTSLSISWGPATDTDVGSIAQYVVEKYETAWSTCGSTGSTNITCSGLTPNTSYKFRILATDNEGESGTWKESGYYSTDMATVGLPGAMTIPSSNSSGSYTVTWGASSTPGVTYNLDEATNSGFSANLRTLVTTNLSYPITGRSSGLTYYYRVTASKSGMNSSSPQLGSNGTVVTLPVELPGAMTIPANNNTGSYTVQWGASSTPSVSYTLEEATNTAFTANKRTLTTSSLNYSITGRSSGKTYYYRVRAERPNYTNSDWRQGSNGTVVNIPFDFKVTLRSMWPDNISTKQTFTLGTTILNDGSGVSPASPLRYYRSIDPLITTGDLEVGTDSVGSIASGDSAIRDVILSSPTILGTYYFGACIDTIAGETNAADNCSAGTELTVSIDEQLNGVFMNLSADPVRSSVRFDNSKEAWSLLSETSDYSEYFRPGDLYSNIIAKGEPSHFIYGYGDFTVFSTTTPPTLLLGEGIRGTAGALDYRPAASTSLGSRMPLILIHGWQGDNGSNNYVGMNSKGNLPEQYFQEFLAFYDSGKDVDGSEAAQHLYQNYKIYLYHYPSFEHITYNGRLLGEAIRRTGEIWNHVLQGGKISIMAHSMGGLVARSFIEEHGIGTTIATGGFDAAGDPAGLFTLSPELSGNTIDHISKLITLATPHHGSPAGMKAWEALEWTSGKNLETPGSLDLFWDDSDTAIHTKFSIGSLQGESGITDWFDYVEGVHRYAWSQRSVGVNQGLFRFDTVRGEKNISFTYSSENGTYEEPNPWLRGLNNNLFISPSTSIRDKYIFYGGAVAIGDFKEHDFIDNGIYFLSASGVSVSTAYGLNDGVVPTRSSFLSLADIDHKEDWSSSGGGINLIWFLRDLDFKYPVPLRYKEGQDIFAKYRYFHDYDHDKMRGGSGASDWNSFSMPIDYATTNWDDHTSFLDYGALLTAIGYPGDQSRINTSNPANLLWYEPLFLRISMDLGYGPQLPPTMGDVPNQSGTIGIGFTTLNLSAYVTQTNGDPIASYAIASGSLPAGLTLDTTTGAITGTPTAAGTFSVTVTASDNDGASNSDAIAFNISAAQIPPVMGNVPNQSGTVGISFTSLNLLTYVTQTNGDPILSYAIASGSLPAGLTLNTTTGVIAGTPTVAGTDNVTVTASDNDGASNSDAVSFNISSNPLPVCSPTATQPVIAAGGSTTLAANCTNSPTAYSWTSTPSSSPKPSGSGGQVYPIVNTTYYVTATNAGGTSVQTFVSVMVNLQPSVCNTITPPNPSVTLGSASPLLTASCSNSPTAHVWKINNATIGSCTTATCVVPSASLAASGTYSVTVTADNAGGSGTQAASITITVPASAYKGFITTIHNYAETADLTAACQAEYGPSYRLADWNDLEMFYTSGGSMSAFFSAMSWLDYDASIFVAYNGQRIFDGSRYYFASRHDGTLPTSYSYLSHANIGSHILDLGSWYGNSMRALCYLPATQLSETWESGTINSANWASYGTPAPQVVPAVGGRSGYVFDNNGDSSYDSGVFSVQALDLSAGASIEADIYLDFSNLAGCWAQASFALSDSTAPIASVNPNWGGFFWSIAAVGDACGGSPANLKGKAWFSFGVMPTGGTWETSDNVINAETYANGWHKARVDILADARATFLIDDTALWTSTQPIDTKYLTGRRLILGSRSSGSAGKAYHDNVKVSNAAVSGPVLSYCCFASSPNLLTFTAQNMGTSSAAQTLTLNNNYGGASLNIASIATTGDFAKTTSCGDSLAVGANCTVSVTFTPTVAGSASGSLTIFSNAPGSPHTVNLSGIGTQVAVPVVLFAPTSLTFSEQAMGTSSAPKTATLTNTGNAALAIAGIAPTGDFAVSNTCGPSLAASASCNLSITFTPSATAGRVGVAKVTSNATGSPHSVILSGTGVLANSPTCRLSAAPAAIPKRGTATLTATCSPAATSFTWTGGNCAGTTLATCTVSPIVTTNYSVMGTNSYGSSTSSAAVKVKSADLSPILMLLLD